MTNNSMAIVRGFITLSDEEKDEVKKALFLSENSDFDEIRRQALFAIMHMKDAGGSSLTGNLGYAYDILLSIETMACK